MVNRTCTKILQSSKMLWPGLSEISFFLLCALSMMINNSAKSAILPISKVKSFLKSNFLPKSNMQHSVYTISLNLEPWRNWPVLFFYCRSEKCLEFIENVKKSELKWKWVDLGPKMHLLRQFRTGYLERDWRVQCNWTAKEMFGISFCVFLTALSRFQASWRGTGRLAMHPPKFDIF